MARFFKAASLLQFGPKINNDIISCLSSLFWQCLFKADDRSEWVVCARQSENQLTEVSDSQSWDTRSPFFYRIQSRSFTRCSFQKRILSKSYKDRHCLHFMVAASMLHGPCLLEFAKPGLEITGLSCTIQLSET